MHPYVIDRMMEDRHQELIRMAQLESRARAARPARYSPWRRTVGRALVAGAVAAGVPRSDRRAARRQVTTTLGFESPC
ncbi:MAG TPA: hypothetical protein VM942_02400 [Acidimicrobiales bacterium]|nr:hypothetical protein [Acidimicrobiales bacterium]